MILLESSGSAFRKTILTSREQPSIHFNISCFFVPSSCHWRARCLLFGISGFHFRIPGAPWETILALREHLGEPFWHFGSTSGSHFGTWDYAGGPWEQQEGHEVAHHRVFVDLGMISGLVYVGFSGPKCFKYRFIFRFVSMLFVYRFLTRFFDVWDFQIVVFAWNLLHKSFFRGNRFQRISESIFTVCLCLDVSFSDFLGLGNKLENETIFDEIPNLTFWICVW